MWLAGCQTLTSAEDEPRNKIFIWIIFQLIHFAKIYSKINVLLRSLLCIRICSVSMDNQSADSGKRKNKICAKCLVNRTWALEERNNYSVGRNAEERQRPNQAYTIFRPGTIVQSGSTWITYALLSRWQTNNLSF